MANKPESKLNSTIQDKLDDLIFKSKDEVSTAALKFIWEEIEKRS